MRRSSGTPALRSAIEGAFGADIDYAMLVKAPNEQADDKLGAVNDE